MSDEKNRDEMTREEIEREREEREKGVDEKDEGPLVEPLEVARDPMVQASQTARPDEGPRDHESTEESVREEVEKMRKDRKK